MGHSMILCVILFCQDYQDAEITAKEIITNDFFPIEERIEDQILMAAIARFMVKEDLAFVSNHRFWYGNGQANWTPVIDPFQIEQMRVYYKEGKTLPKLDEIKALFPTQQTILDNCIVAAGYRDTCKNIYDCFGPSWQGQQFKENFYDKALQNVELWYAMREAINTNSSGLTRRRYLQQIREIVGDKNYYSGNFPSPLE